MIAAEVIPLRFLGQQDSGMTKMSATELMSWAFVNLWQEGGEGGYAVKHGNKPVSTFGFDPKGLSPADDKNYWERAFPVLFPYGRGGFEQIRQTKVSLTNHVRWALQYCDHRFRCHPTFSFVAFGILQRREALLSAKIQMNRVDFKREAALLQSVTQERMKRAAEEEANGQMISDVGIKALRKHVHAVAGRVTATDASRIKLRSMMWSLSYMISPPNLWITINPDDIDDPIVQILAGENFDLDRFDPDPELNKTKRSLNVAGDPYAAAQYFNLIVRAVLEHLFGIKLTPNSGRLVAKRGIFGKIKAYFGIVESQGRGTLHLHLLLWLCGSPSGTDFVSLLETEEFRELLKAFIKENIHGRCPGLESLENARKTPVKQCVAWQRLPTPVKSADYWEHLNKVEWDVARAKQVHTCKPASCLQLQNSSRRLVCKRKAPWDCCEDALVRADGYWCPERTWGYVNQWNPVLATHLRCNHDIKILTNGRESCRLTFYCTCYAAKKQKRSHNVSALLAKHYAFKQSEDVITRGIQDAGRLMVYRCLDAMNREQEVAAPMVVSYLMGFGDLYKSHAFDPIYWTRFVLHLYDNFPSLRTASRV